MEKCINFVNSAKETHGEKYDYNQVVYKNCDTKVKIKCPIHDVFEQTPYLHIRSGGCPKCVNIRKRQQQVRTKEQLIAKFHQIHKHLYDYSLVERADSFTKVKIICRIHGIFEQTPAGHIAKNGCQQCGIERVASAKKLLCDESAHDKMIKKFIELHGERYDYSQVKFGLMNDLINIICKNHGPFSQSVTNHVKGQGCKKMRS